MVRHRGFTVSILVLILIGSGLSSAIAAQSPLSLTGKWRFSSPEIEVSTEFFPDGTFRQAAKSGGMLEAVSGRFQFDGRTLTLVRDDDPAPKKLSCRLADPDTLIVQDPAAGTLTMRKLSSAGSGGETGTTRRQPPASPDMSPRAPSDPVPAAARPTILMKRVWESNERAFVFPLPQGWLAEGGIFNVDPFKMNGPGNTISPKLDLTVKSDERGTIILRWAPGWNFADLSLSPSGWGTFRPGMYYQGMPCRVLVSPEDFLTGLFRETRPGASDPKVVTTDPMPEVVRAYEEKTASVNAGLRRMGLPPIQITALAMAVEYSENGTRYREVLSTTLVDNRGGAFQWSNGDTIQYRAPLDRFDVYKPVLDAIRLGREWNPEWLRSVAYNSGKRAQESLETQQYINRVSNEIVENRRRTNAEIRHEDWLFISGQEEYRNPFTGRIERDTSQWRYRWVNNEGEVLYTDENGFDPNQVEEYKTRVWKRTPVKQIFPLHEISDPTGTEIYQKQYSPIASPPASLHAKLEREPSVASPLMKGEGDREAPQRNGLS